MDLAVLKLEEKKISDFLGKKIFLNQPNISAEDLKKFQKLGFNLHFLPEIELSGNSKFVGWHDAPKRNFYQLVEQGRLFKNSLNLPGKWVLIDGRAKPVRCYPWLAKDDVLVVLSEKILGINWLKKCRGFNKQQYENDFLLEILKKNGFNSRFSLTWQQIDEIIKPEVAKTLLIDSNKIRLPKFAEWNFLGNLFYPEWSQTSTWEWFSDRLKTGECLAGGAGSLSVLGWDPPDLWSNILGFRFMIEI